MLHSILAGITRATNTLAIACNALGTLVVLALVVVLNVDVIARGFFSSPINGTYEIVQFSVELIVFLQLADVVRVDRLTRSDGFLNVIGTRRPMFAANLRRMINAVSAIFMGLIAYITFSEFLHMWNTQDYFGVPGLFTLPWWPVKLVISIGTALACVIFVLKVITAVDRPHQAKHEVSEGDTLPLLRLA